MQVSGGMITREGLSLMGGAQSPEGNSMDVTTRMFDTDGDGRVDLFLVDLDNDGEVDGAVRGLDTDGDGKNDTYVQYNEDGEIQSVGRVNAMGRLEVTSYEEPGLLDELLDMLHLRDLDAPDAELFASFDNPYIYQTFGNYGVEVPEVYVDSVTINEVNITQVNIVEIPSGELESLTEGVTVVDEEETEGVEVTPDRDVNRTGVETESEGLSSGPGAADATAQSGEVEIEPQGQDSSDQSTDATVTAEAAEESTARITEIRDYSGAQDGSNVWAKVDTDADGMADTDERLWKGNGEYYGDINKDGSSEKVATDQDRDGHIDTVDTTGQGYSTDQADTSQVAEPQSEHLVDKYPGEDDNAERFSEERATSSPDTGTSEAATYDATDSFSAEDSTISQDGSSSYSASASSDTSPGDSTSSSYDPASNDSGGTDSSSYDAGSVDTNASYDASSTYDAGTDDI